ncbi:MAG: NAD(P)/FAD-dependent oxidoreductase [Clostridia bacterium]|nr:NAD(P)/FAD-dependent oxidoreductase [Clostridia bacterium]
MTKADIVIIGGGITGTMIARELSAYDLRTVLIEKENDIADGATMANSAIVHTGYDPEEDTLKGLLNVKGARLYDTILEEMNCRYLETGAFIAACGEEEEKHLDVLMGRADRRGIPYRVLTGDEARTEEPNLSDEVTKVIDFYTTKVIYPWEVALKAAKVAVNNGVTVLLGHEVTDIEKKNGMYAVHAGEELIEASCVINTAGIMADRIASFVEEPRFTMRPRRGEYYVLDKDVHLVDHIIFPVPSEEKGKGVLAVPTVYGNTLIGPNSDYIDDREDNGTSYYGLGYVRKNMAKTLKNVPFNRSIRTFAGIRPASTSSDFIIEESESSKGFINVASIESPGLASSPAIAEYVIENFISKRFELVKKEDADMTLPKDVVLSEMTEDERNSLIKERPEYGRIVCRCEQVSEGEILDAIKGPLGATTVKGVKKRCRPGMGRCQGGFCEPLVMEILARELHKDPLDIELDGKGSYILERSNR